MYDPVTTWSYALCLAAIVNIAAWIIVAGCVHHRKPHASSPNARLLLWLSAIYVAGCAFRSLFPLVDGIRACLHDVTANRVAIGRTVATFAEIAFAVQCAVVLHDAGRASRSRVAGAVTFLIVPTIVAAEFASWWAVLTRNNLFHFIENGLWTLAATVAAVAFLAAAPRLSRRSRLRCQVIAATAGAYVAFMVTVDLPMYIRRWQSASLADVVPLTSGFAEILAPCVVVRDAGLWAGEMPWMTLYFTVAVWISLSLPLMRSFATIDASLTTGEGNESRHHATRWQPG